MNLQWVAPELRQGNGEISLSALRALPTLLELSDIRGDLHLHTEWSDGTATIEQMARTAGRLGYEFLAITDHSQSLKIANGLGPERLLRQIDFVQEWNSSGRSPRILSGIEVDILPDGGLDLPDSLLARLDWVVASVHSSMSQPKNEMMRRLQRAIENRHVDALGHPTGRLLGKPGQVFYQREPYAVDVDRLIKLCSENQVGLEINCFPERMDLCSELAEQASTAGVPLHIGTDAHAPHHLGLMRYGVDVARCAGLEASAIRNTLCPESLAASLQRTSKKGAVRNRVGEFVLTWDFSRRTLDRLFKKASSLRRGRFRVVGIDLTASEARPSGWALLAGSKASTQTLKTDEDLVAATLDGGAHLVSIDSPLSLPKGRCCANDDCACREHGIVRACERSLMRMRVGVFPSLLPSMQGLTKRGIEVAAMFRDRGVEVIESYPGAAQDMLGISRKKRGIGLLHRALAEFGIELPEVGNLTHDELDAVTSALVGYYSKADEYLALGDPDENELIVPRNPRFREGKESVVIALAGLPGSGKTSVGEYLAFRYGFRYTRYSQLLRQMLYQENPAPSRNDLREFGWRVHQTMGPVELTNRLIETMTFDENWVVDGLRHVGDWETLKAHFGERCHLVFVEASGKSRAKRIAEDPSREVENTDADIHPVEGETPLLSFRTTLRIDNSGSLKALFDHVDRLLGAR